jgi:hypothetical protein
MSIHQKPIKAGTAVLPASRKKWIESQYTEELAARRPCFHLVNLSPKKGPTFCCMLTGE